MTYKDLVHLCFSAGFEPEPDATYEELVALMRSEFDDDPNPMTEAELDASHGTERDLVLA